MHAEPRSKDACLTTTAATAYDRIAADYDRLVEGDAWMRRALHAHYLRVYRPGMRILDVGCGTGIDTVMLAAHGIRVVAIDVSPAMVELTIQNAARAGVGPLVSVSVLDAAAIAQLDGPFDGAVSAFAALSTVPDLARVASGVADLVRPGGRVVVHMLNRLSSWEWLGLVRGGDWHGARNLGRTRLREFTIGGQRVQHNLYYAREAYALLSTDFVLRRAYSLGALRPPHTLQRVPGPIVAGLEWLDVRLGGLPRLRDAGRFFVLDLERRARAG